MRRLFLLIPVALLISVLTVDSRDVWADKTSQWPTVAPLEKVYHFDHLSTARIEVIIASPNKNPLYHLVCADGEYKGSSECDFSGFLYCCMTPNTGKGSLLLEQYASRDWQTRARFSGDEIVGKCGDHPEFGRERTFRLRGMALTIGISDLKIIKAKNAEAEDASFSLQIKVVPDPNATTRHPEPPRYREPVRKNNEVKDCSVIERSKNEIIEYEKHQMEYYRYRMRAILGESYDEEKDDEYKP